MTNTTQTVHTFLIKNPSITRNMKDSLINVRALALHILKRTNLKASPHAVISAIRRFNTEEKSNEFGDIQRSLASAKISTKSRLVYISLLRDFFFLAQALPQILKKINPSVGELLRIVEGRKSFKILIDHAKKDEILSLITPTNVLELTENLGEINIQFEPNCQSVRGVRASILNVLSLHNIQLYEIIGCMPELILIINEKDIGTAHDLLLSFFYNR